MKEIKLDGDYPISSRVMYEMYQVDKYMEREDFFRRDDILTKIQSLAMEQPCTLEVRDIYFLLSLPSEHYLKRKRTETMKKGFIAGDVLCSLYLIHKFNLDPEPSLKKAISAVSQYAQEIEFGDETKIPHSKTRIKEIWSQMKPVSHLWAAERLNSSYQYSDRERIYSPGNITTFLAVAKELYNFGTTFIPHRARPQVPVLDTSELVKLPDELQPLMLIAKQTQFPDLLNKYIQAYEA